MTPNIRSFAAILLGLLIAGCSSSPKKTAVICNPECRTQDTSIQQAELRALPPENPSISRLAEEANNSPKAAYDLALRYFRGDGVIRDPYKSITWMRSSAERGDVNAQKALGRFYLTGLEEMGPDPQEAQSWLAAAAAQGDKESEQLLEEANAARRTQEAEYGWMYRWRPRIYRAWFYDYPYYGTWNGHYWYYR